MQEHPPYYGKVRDVYYLGSDRVLMVTRDSISAYDHILPFEVPGKGLMLNQIASYFLKATEDIIPNWLIASPNPRVLFGYCCDQILIEMVVRGCFEGSIVEAYNNGQRVFWGYTLPDGLKPGDKLPEIIVTPTTKSHEGHDKPITRSEIVSRGILSEEDYYYLHDISIKLFIRGQEMAAKMGLILVDTKYEFGKYKGKFMLTDEIHTPDSSRYYYAEGYADRQAKGEPQRQLSKEFVRQDLKVKGFEGKTGQKMPEFAPEYAQQVSDRYRELYRTLMGKDFKEQDFKDAENPVTVYEQSLYCVKASICDMAPIFGIIMGSKSDLEVMNKAAEMCKNFSLPYELTVVSAHRTPDRLRDYALSAIKRGLQIIIAGAGGAAHLPGMVQSYSTLPVIGVPIKSSNSLEGIDSIYSILQMPKGVPVLTVALNQAENAAISALQIVALKYPYYAEQIKKHKEKIQDETAMMVNEVKALGHPNFYDVK